MAKLLNFTIESDPFAWLALLAGLLLGVGLYYVFVLWRMEDGLRSRRSPNNVRLEAIAVAMVLAAAFPCLASAWGFGWFLVILVIGIVLAVWGRSSLLGWALLALGVILAVAAMTLGRTPSSHNAQGSAFKAVAPAPTQH